MPPAAYVATLPMLVLVLRAPSSGQQVRKWGRGGRDAAGEEGRSRAGREGWVGGLGLVRPKGAWCAHSCSLVRGCAGSTYGQAPHPSSLVWGCAVVWAWVL